VWSGGKVHRDRQIGTSEHAGDTRTSGVSSARCGIQPCLVGTHEATEHKASVPSRGATSHAAAATAAQCQLGSLGTRMPVRRLQAHTAALLQARGSFGRQPTCTATYHATKSRGGSRSAAKMGAGLRACWAGVAAPICGQKLGRPFLKHCP